MRNGETEGRWRVIWYADKRGRWYAVIDALAPAHSNIVYASRSRAAAHREASSRQTGLIPCR